MQKARKGFPPRSVGFPPFFELRPVGAFRFRRSGPVREQGVFVDEIHAEQGGVFAPFQSRIRIPVLHPAAYERFPVFHRFPVDGQKSFHCCSGSGKLIPFTQ